MISTSPIVSIIIPTKDRSKLLRETIDSLLRQTFSQWEAIVVDDGSSDDTADWVTDLSKSDNRIRYLARETGNPGAPACRNVGVSVSAGKYVIFLDSDDCLAPYALQTRVRSLDENKDVDFIVSHCLMFRETPGDSNLLWNKETDEEHIDRFLQADVPWQTAGPTWRREALETVGPWNESLPFWQDWEHHIRALTKQLSYLVEPIVDFHVRMPNSKRQTISGSSFDRSAQQYWTLILLVRDELARSDMLTSRRKQYLSGICLWLSERWSRRFNLESAVVIQREALQQGLISEGFFRLTRIYYSRVINGFRPTRSLTKLILTRYLRLNYPVSIIAKTMKKISIDDAGLVLDLSTGKLTSADN